MASIYKCITSYKLPSSIKGFGGLGYDNKGELIVGPIIFDFGGPWASYDEMYKKAMDKQLALADGSALFDGWRRNGLRERLEMFRAEGMGDILAKVTDKTPTLVHGDFDLLNMMFDPATNTITGLLDFDFAHIASPADEFFYSFGETRGLVTAIFEEKIEVIKLRQFLIGEAELSQLAPPLVDSLSTSTDETPLAEASIKETDAGWSDGIGIDWALAAKWNTALITAGATRPRDLDGLGELSNLYWFIQEVCSPYMLMPRWLARFNEQEKLEKVANVEKRLVKCLEHWGY
ncbi:hypothetical protein BKA67DRAFT_571159 [Truncatella angustata]|uniref:Aminoglycoside phosphotransferase domain-containing protein n=1 Tax=Truncatella angustata TaxID=152316 RepID=A0A9P8UG09_9PEZI|nr:uncharacterized protein BKA67DRAFT_571159 [Truncatella angustata]KAH6651534.1 hypothetical protein BKA67DRAFT_571159 [Truncatella angustata]